MNRELPSPPRDGAHFLESLAGSPDPLFVTDRHNRIVLWNRAAERLLGYTDEEMVGTACAAALEGCDVYGNRYCSETCPVTQIALRGESVQRFTLKLKVKGGELLDVDVSVLNVPAPPPDRFYLAHVIHASRRPEAELADVTEPAPPTEALVTARESPDARARRLTAREVEVLGMLAAGHMTPDIASRLNISALTARNHIQNILDKLEVHSKAEAVAFAFQKRIL